MHVLYYYLLGDFLNSYWKFVKKKLLFGNNLCFILKSIIIKISLMRTKKIGKNEMDDFDPTLT